MNIELIVFAAVLVVFVLVDKMYYMAVLRLANKKNTELMDRLMAKDLAAYTRQAAATINAEAVAETIRAEHEDLGGAFKAAKQPEDGVVL